MSGRVHYALSTSLDGFAADPDGGLGWVSVTEEIHAAFNDESRAVGTSLYGRRMYELMAGYWPTADADPGATPAEVEFARIWRATPKVVFSRTLASVEHNSRLVRDDAVAEVARLKAEGLVMDVSGPTLAGSLLAAGLVDDVSVFVNPVVLGAGLRFFPALDAPVGLRLVGTQTFDSGVVRLRYEVTRRD